MDNIEEIKSKIKSMIENNYIMESTELLKKLIVSFPTDIELYSMLAVCLINSEKYDEAIEICNLGMEIDINNFDLNYNLGYIYEAKGSYSKAIPFYNTALDQCKDDTLMENLKDIISNLNKGNDVKISKKIVFFVKEGMDSFLGDVISNYSKSCIVRKVIVSRYDQIDEAMEWADICWFEWCDELITYASNKYYFYNKKIVCRLHSYEAFTDNIFNVNWNNVDKVIFISEEIRNYVISKVNMDISKTKVIPNGIDIRKFKYRKGKCGFSIAYVGYINYKKGPMLLLHAFKAIFDFDKRYKLFIAGEFQDERDKLYFNQMIKVLNIEENVIFEGWQKDLNQWLENKDYIICTSLLESQNVSIMQAMSKGIKPLIHNFVGASKIYPQEYIWNTIEDLIKMINSENYRSVQYRGFIEKKYSLNLINKLYNEFINEFSYKLEAGKEEKPLVSICITSYNYSHYIDECIMSVLNQTYKNIELIIIDDDSKDDSRSKLKEYENKYSNIKCLFNETNRGYKYGINKFIKELCNGKYFIVLSADDALAKDDTVERYVNYFEENDGTLDFIYGDMIVFDENKNITQHINTDSFSANEVVLKTFNRYGSGVLPFLFSLHRSEFYKKNNFYWDEYNECSNDTLNCLIAISKGAKYAKFAYPVFKYRVHGKNDTFNFEGRIRDVSAIVEYIIEKYNSVLFANIKNATDEEKTVFLIKYYYKFIMYYLNDYMVFGTSKVNLLKEDKIKYMRRIIDKFFDYVKIYEIKCYSGCDEYISNIKNEIKL